ncbi:MAG: hypothetical protein H8D97_00925 [Proteobacteria bacterium]|nr:hypothetical protein [Pseudomonadota bacterium]
MKDDLFNQLDEGDEDNSSENQFKDNFGNLTYDINYIDNKIQNIQGHISILENKLNMVQQSIQNAHKQQNNPNSIDISKLYNAFNKMYELLSLFQKTEQTYLDLKFKYRNEQNDLKYKLVRMDEIDKKRITEMEGISNTDIISALGNLLDNQTSKENTIKELEDDPKYKI